MNNDLFENHGNIDICYAAMPNTLIIRPDGRIAKCTVFFNHEANHVGDISEDGNISINPYRFAFWTAGFGNGDDKYLTHDKTYLNCPAKKLKEYIFE